MLAWRIVRPDYVAKPLSGAGAARLGSRWNSIGVEMVYASTSRALAVLEMLVHVARNNAARDAVFIPIEIPDSLVSGLPDLPDGWNHFPYRKASRIIGDRWLEQSSSLAMLVPSAVLPAERNLLINPGHALFGQVRVGEPEPHAFDRRLFGSRA